MKLLFAIKHYNTLYFCNNLSITYLFKEKTSVAVPARGGLGYLFIFCGIYLFLLGIAGFNGKWTKYVCVGDIL